MLGLSVSLRRHTDKESLRRCNGRREKRAESKDEPTIRAWNLAVSISACVSQIGLTTAHRPRTRLSSRFAEGGRARPTTLCDAARRAREERPVNDARVWRSRSAYGSGRDAIGVLSDDSRFPARTHRQHAPISDSCPLRSRLFPKLNEQERNVSAVDRERRLESAHSSSGAAAPKARSSSAKSQIMVFQPAAIPICCWNRA